MKKLKNYTLKEYLNVLSKKEPVPGGGSAAALMGALGVSLLSMAANYSVGKNKSKTVDSRIKNKVKRTQEIRDKLLELIDLDAEAYMKVVKSKNATKKEKIKALKEAKKIPSEIASQCYKAVQLAPYLVEHGSKYLLSDIEIAVEMLLAAFNSAMALLRY